MQYRTSERREYELNDDLTKVSNDLLTFDKENSMPTHYTPIHSSQVDQNQYSEKVQVR